MTERLIGVCQHCGRKVEFAAGQSGQWAACDHCGRQTRLKPAPVELLEAAPEAASSTEEKPVMDAAERQLRRKYVKLAILTLILLGMLAGMLAVAEWLRGLAKR